MSYVCIHVECVYTAAAIAQEIFIPFRQTEPEQEEATLGCWYIYIYVCIYLHVDKYTFNRIPWQIRFIACYLLLRAGLMEASDSFCFYFIFYFFPGIRRGLLFSFVRTVMDLCNISFPLSLSLSGLLNTRGFAVYILLSDWRDLPNCILLHTSVHLRRVPSAYTSFGISQQKTMGYKIVFCACCPGKIQPRSTYYVFAGTLNFDPYSFFRLAGPINVQRLKDEIYKSKEKYLRMIVKPIKLKMMNDQIIESIYISINQTDFFFRYLIDAHLATTKSACRNDVTFVERRRLYARRSTL